MKSGSEELHEYCERYTSPQNELLENIERQTHLKTTQPRMLSGHLQGRFLSMISKLHQPDRILEIGTFTGYASLCLAEGLSQEGMLHTVEINEELDPIIRKHWADSPLKDKMKLHIGDAKEFIVDMDENWDLVFLDAAKKDYPTFFELLQSKMDEGGIIIADNVLWSGKVLDDNNTDKSTTALRKYAQVVYEHPDWEQIMVPLRDGLLISRKIN
jgi:predicted O-methyltransferase YrrM